MTGPLAAQIPIQDLFNGLVTGVVYAAFALGFVLVYRSNRVFNFAHGEIGAFSLTVFALLSTKSDLPWVFAAVGAIVIGSSIGGITQAFVLRRFSDTTELTMLIATIGVGTSLAALRLQLPRVTTPGPLAAAFNMRWALGNHLTILGRDVAVLTVLPVALIVVGLLISRTSLGLSTRAVASDLGAAALVGIRVEVIRTAIWVLAGGLAAITMVVAAPLDNTSAAQVASLGIGPPLLVRAFAITLLAGHRSIRTIVALSIVIGVAEEVLSANVSARGLVDVWLFVAIVVAIGTNETVRSDRFTSWNLGRGRGLLSARRASSRQNEARLIVFVLVLTVALSFIFSAPSTMLVATNVAVFAIAASSVTVLTGWGGYLSFAQYTLVGIGAMTTAALTNGHPISLPYGLLGTASVELPWLIAAGLAVALGAGVAVALSLATSRYQRRLLAVTTLAFSVAGSSWLFGLDFFSNGARSTAPPTAPALNWLWLDVDFGASRRVYFWLVVGSLTGVLFLLRAIRSRPTGIAIIASSESSQLLASCGYSPWLSQVQAFVLSGAIASFAGVLFATAQPSLAPATMFGPRASINVVSASVIGGLGQIIGPVAGALWVRGLTAAWQNDWVRLLTSDIGLLLVLLYRPGGLAGIGHRGDMAGRAPTGPLVIGSSASRNSLPTHTALTCDPVLSAVSVRPGQPALALQDMSVTFGELRLVSSIDLYVDHNEIVGLIGTNGAGKTTVLDAISGFAQSTGSVQICGRRFDNSSPATRHKEGLGRTFQDPSTHSALSVSEWLMLAANQSESTARKPEEALKDLGISHLANESLGQTSLAAQRRVDLARTLVLGSQVLLFDEPTGGLSYQERVAHVDAILATKSRLDAAVLIVEHDLDLMTDLCDRFYCLVAGSVIASGRPEDVLNNPLVRDTYLGLG